MVNSKQKIKIILFVPDNLYHEIIISAQLKPSKNDREKDADPGFSLLFYSKRTEILFTCRRAVSKPDMSV